MSGSPENGVPGTEERIPGWSAESLRRARRYLEMMGAITPDEPLTSRHLLLLEMEGFGIAPFGEELESREW